MHVGHNGRSFKTVARFIRAHGCSAQDWDEANVALNSGKTIAFLDKFLYLGSWAAVDFVLFAFRYLARPTKNPERESS
jgi:hypothetical protein